MHSSGICGPQPCPVVQSIRPSIRAERRLMGGDLATTELTPCVDGYYAQIRRTLVLGEPSAAQLSAFGVYIEAVEAGYAVLRAGVTRARWQGRRPLYSASTGSKNSPPASTRESAVTASVCSSNPSGLATPDDTSIFEFIRDGQRAAMIDWNQGFMRGAAGLGSAPIEEARELGRAPLTSIVGSLGRGDETILHGPIREWRRRLTTALSGRSPRGEGYVAVRREPGGTWRRRVPSRARRRACRTRRGRG